MIARIGMIAKKDDLTMEQFDKHWFEVHGPMARRIPGMYRYDQNHIVDKQQLGIRYTRSSFDFDGFSQLYFDDLWTMENGFASDPQLAKALSDDISVFLNRVDLVITLPNVVVPLEGDKPLIKRISLLKRRPDVTPANFHREWLEVHAGMVKAMPGVEAYTQNLVIDRIVDGKSVPYEQLPVDGIVELWFEDVDKLNASFASEEAQRTLAHGRTFIAEVTTFLVEVRRVL